MLPRRTLLAAPLALWACRREKANGFDGHAFVANEEGHAIAAVDLSAFVVTRHIRVDGAPRDVIAHPDRDAVWTFTAGNGTLHEIDPSKLVFRRKSVLGVDIAGFALHGDHLWVLLREPRKLLRVPLDTLRPDVQISFSAEPVSFSLDHDARTAAILHKGGLPTLVDLEAGGRQRRIATPYPVSLAGFQADGRQLLCGAGADRMLTVLNVESGAVVTNLPLALEPKRFCFKEDGGELYVTGPGLDAVVIVYPYRTEVGETVLAGRLPGDMAAVSTLDAEFLFVANPESGDVTVLNLATHRMLSKVAVGKGPGFITITPDKQYALVLNRISGDMAVIRIKAITRNRAKFAPLFTMIPVGSKPVAACVRAV